MRFKPALGALALAAAAATAHAENINLGVPLVANAAQPGSFSAGFGVTHTLAGAFTDTLTFTGAAAGFISASLVTLGFQTNTNINFTSVSLNGNPLTLTAAGTFETASLSPTLVNAPVVLTVTGVAAPGTTVGTAIAASYAGTVNVSPVPEPGTTALLLAGLGAVGWLSRRRLSV